MTCFDLSLFFVLPWSEFVAKPILRKKVRAAPRHFISPTHSQATSHMSPSHPMTLHSTFPPNHTLPAHPRTHISHPHPSITPSIPRARKICSIVFPNFSSQSRLHGLRRAIDTECESRTLALYQWQPRSPSRTCLLCLPVLMSLCRSCIFSSLPVCLSAFCALRV